MKKIFIFALIVILSLVVVGCTNTSTTTTDVIDTRFIDTGDRYKIGDMDYQVYYDSTTKVVYIIEARIYRSGISVMYNSEGKPMMLDEYYEAR